MNQWVGQIYRPRYNTNFNTKLLCSRKENDLTKSFTLYSSYNHILPYIKHYKLTDGDTIGKIFGDDGDKSLVSISCTGAAVGLVERLCKLTLLGLLMEED